MKPEFTNPWPYAETLPALTENMKLSREGKAREDPKDG